MKNRRRHTDEHSNHERWLLTYADLITLLLGLFVILYAISKVDAARYEKVISAFSGIFGGGSVQLQTSPAGVLRENGTLVSSERQRIQEAVLRAIGRENLSGAVSLSDDQRGITVHILDELLFQSGSATIKTESFVALDALAAVIASIPNDVRIEGHTDNVPIHTAGFPSNWHLSVARALNTAYYIIEHHGIRAERLSVVGYAEFRPLAPNTTDENRARNRRVDLVILTSAMPDAPGSQPLQSSGIH